MKIIVVGFLIIFAWYKMALRPVDSSSEIRVPVTIESGSSSRSIASALKEKELIRSERAFLWYTKLHGMQGSLQAGKFVLQRNDPVSVIAETLQSAVPSEAVITVPEGFTVKDIDTLLAKKGLIEQGELIRCANKCDFVTYDFLPNKAGLAERGGKLEGYLYPDTYYVPTDNFVAKFFLERMLNRFRNVIVKEFIDDIEDSGRSLHDIITMASLIEEESRKDGEREMVSHILWKRVDADWGLGVDATVRYIVDKPSAAITHADLNSNSPYNTRKFKALPPGPIASPGYKSIKASIHPKESPYWYYLHDKTGQIHYSVTNEEHNVKRYRLLK